MSEVFGEEPFFLAYVKWHYGKGLHELFSVAGNFLWFVTNFFSFKLLIISLDLSVKCSYKSKLSFPLLIVVLNPLTE